MSKEAEPYLVDMVLPEEMGSITVARDLARRVMEKCGYQGRQEDVLLVVSELVTNALVHGDGPPVLRMAGSEEHIRVEVGDAGAERPQPRDPGPSSGWGLHVVRLLSTGWGISADGDGKVVWCELAARLAPLRAHPSEA